MSTNTKTKPNTSTTPRLKAELKGKKAGKAVKNTVMIGVGAVATGLSAVAGACSGFFKGLGS